MKELQSIVGLLFIVLLATVGFLFYSSMNHSEIEDKENEVIGFCGNSNPSLEYASGKNLFKMSCASCHHKGMNMKAIGPALKGTFDLWNKDTVQYMNYLNDSETFFKTNKDERLLGVREAFQSFSHKNDFKLKDVKDLIEYIEMKY